MSITAMKQALEYITATNKSSSFWMVPESNLNKTVTALRAAIAEAEKQEPFGYFQYAMHFDAWVQNRDSNTGVAFYTTPPAAQRQPLTEKEIADIWDEQFFHITDMSLAIDFVRDIEAAHGIGEKK